MTSRPRNALWLALLAATAGAGCGPSWVVVKQAHPNLLAGKRSFRLDVVSWEGLSIGGNVSETDWIAKKKPADQEGFKTGWAKDKADAASAFATRFGEGLRGFGGTVAPSPGGDAVGIKPHIDMYDPGFWSPMGFGNANTIVVMTVDVADGSGAVQDTVKFTATVVPGTLNAAPGQRLGQAAQDLGGQVAAYLKSRTAGR